MNDIVSNEAVVHAELERYMFKAKDILLENRDFPKKIATASVTKETLLYSDVKVLRKIVTITEATI